MENRADQPGQAVVTGGAGFLGSHVCDALLRAGHKVTCIDDFETGRLANVRHLEDDSRFRLIHGDVSDGADIDGPVDVVYHLAAAAAPSDYVLDPVATMRVASMGP